MTITSHRRQSSPALPPFAALLRAHGADVHRFLVAVAGRAEADDCYQETWLAALRAYPTLRSGENLRGWLLRIAQRKAIDAHRRRRRAPVPTDDPAAPALPAAEPPSGVWAAVAALPERQRLAIAHRYVNDLPYAEIAAILDCSEDAARQSVRAGLRRLREEVPPA